MTQCPLLCPSGLVELSASLSWHQAFRKGISGKRFLMLKLQFFETLHYCSLKIEPLYNAMHCNRLSR